MYKFLRILKIISLVLLMGFALYLVFLKGDIKEEETQTEEQSTKTEVSQESVFLGSDGVYAFKDETLIVNAKLPKDAEEIVSYGDSQIDRFVSMRKEAGDLETSSFPWNLDMSYTKHESDRIVSYLVQGYEYTGGAHGNTFLESFNYDKETGKRINVMDIISEQDSLNVFAALADKELTVEYPEGSSGTKENWNIWYADNSSVTFIFVPYQIASYATGQQELTIVATGDNASLFNQEYFK